VFSESEAEGGDVQKENSDDGNKPNLSRMVIRHAMSPDTHRDLQIGGKDSKTSLSMKNGLHEDHEQVSSFIMGLCSHGVDWRAFLEKNSEKHLALQTLHRQ
jgi:hypothetical protein